MSMAGIVAQKSGQSQATQEAIFLYKHGEEITVQEIVAAIGVEASTARRHLNALTYNGLMSRVTRNRQKYFTAAKSPSDFFYIDFKYIEPAMRLQDTQDNSHLTPTLKSWFGYLQNPDALITKPTRIISHW